MVNRLLSGYQWKIEEIVQDNREIGCHIERLIDGYHAVARGVGACTNTSGDCVVTIDQALNVTANFAIVLDNFLYLPLITR